MKKFIFGLIAMGFLFYCCIAAMKQENDQWAKKGFGEAVQGFADRLSKYGEKK